MNWRMSSNSRPRLERAPSSMRSTSSTLACGAAEGLPVGDLAVLAIHFDLNALLGDVGGRSVGFFGHDGDDSLALALILALREGGRRDGENCRCENGEGSNGSAHSSSFGGERCSGAAPQAEPAGGKAFTLSLDGTRARFASNCVYGRWKGTQVRPKQRRYRPGASPSRICNGMGCSMRSSWWSGAWRRS
jgi:hypothetical protein